MNPVSGIEKQHDETSQNKTIDTNNLEKVVTVPEKISKSSRNQKEPKNIFKQKQAFSLSKEIEKVKIQVPLL